MRLYYLMKTASSQKEQREEAVGKVYIIDKPDTHHNR